MGRDGTDRGGYRSPSAGTSGLITTLSLKLGEVISESLFNIFRYIFKPEVPALRLLYPPLSVPSQISIWLPNYITNNWLCNQTQSADFAPLRISLNSNQNSIRIPQSAAAAFPTRILIEILEEFLIHLNFATKVAH